LLDELAREGARKMLAAALRAEADAYVDSLTKVVDGNGHRLVVRNGHAEPVPRQNPTWCCDLQVL
jgi:hypothetical protein